MRFLHCGDLHIGAGRGDGREEDFATAFLEVAALAVDRQVDFVLIAGDLFDRREINPQALGQAFHQFFYIFFHILYIRFPIKP